MTGLLRVSALIASVSWAMLMNASRFRSVRAVKVTVGSIVASGRTVKVTRSIISSGRAVKVTRSAVVFVAWRTVVFWTVFAVDGAGAVVLLLAVVPKVVLGTVLTVDWTIVLLLSIVLLAVLATMFMTGRTVVLFLMSLVMEWFIRGLVVAGFII